MLVFWYGGYFVGGCGGVGFGVVVFCVGVVWVGGVVGDCLLVGVCG